MRRPPLFVVVYDLRADRKRVAAMQDASFDGGGLSDEPALVGSDLWWSKLGDPQLPLHVASGTVSGSYWTGHGDYPQFDLLDSDGVTTTWERYGDETRYVPGLAIRLEYVEQAWRSTRSASACGGTSRVVTRVEIEDSERREVGSGKRR